MPNYSHTFSLGTGQYTTAGSGSGVVGDWYVVYGGSIIVYYRLFIGYNYEVSGGRTWRLNRTYGEANNCSVFLQAKSAATSGTISLSTPQINSSFSGSTKSAWDTTYARGGLLDLSNFDTTSWRPIYYICDGSTYLYGLNNNNGQITRNLSISFSGMNPEYPTSSTTASSIEFTLPSGYNTTTFKWDKSSVTHMSANRTSPYNAPLLANASFTLPTSNITSLSGSSNITITYKLNGSGASFDDGTTSDKQKTLNVSQAYSNPTWSAYNKAPGSQATSASSNITSTLIYTTTNNPTSIGNLPGAKRTGYTLNGWYTAASGGSQVTNTTQITTSTTYYAQWSGNPYNVVIYNDRDAKYNGVSYESEYDQIQCPNGPITKYYGTPHYLTSVTITKTGYSFVGYGTGASLIHGEETLYTTELGSVFDANNYKEGAQSLLIKLYPKYNYVNNIIKTKYYSFSQSGIKETDYSYNIKTPKNYKVPVVTESWVDHALLGWVEGDSSGNPPAGWTNNGIYSNKASAIAALGEGNIISDIIVSDPSSETTWGITAKTYYGVWISSGKNIKINGDWKNCSESYIKINNEWKPIDNFYIKINNSWKQEIN